jgi:hypothetical protein
MHPYLLEDLATTRVQELRREVWRRRLHEHRDLVVDPAADRIRAARARRPSIARRVVARALQAVGFWLVAAGLRLAVAGTGRRAGP